ncbi:MAG: hypothetical protein JXO72_16680 [Vicinamibacteria bacterium]|nr:hypothetical protein [Vicinamibacteria bacterium]
MVPLLALDQAFGWSDWENFGRIIHLHGELFVLGALVLVAWSVRAGGGSAHAAAAAVVLAGFSWPFWMIARRAGPEPVVAFLVALFVAGQIGAPKTTGGGANAASRAAWVRGLVCAVLPWVHATGPVVAVALVVAEALVAWRAAGSEPGRVRRTLLACTPVLLGVTLGLLSWLWLWNYLYHGSWWGGGYAQYRGDRFFRLHNPLIGFWRYGRDAAVQTPLLFLIAVLGWRKVARSAITDVALFLAAALIVFFSPFSSEEPARRLSPIVPALAVVVGLAWDRLRWSPIAARLLLAISIPIGDFWLFRLESFAPTRWGDFPPILWIRLADQGAPSWLTVVPVLVLIAVALFAIDRLNTSLRAGAMPDSN